MKTRPSNKPTLTSELLLASLVGACSILLHYRGFGVGDQAEHLPIILRAMDTSYLPNDFVTNAVAGTIARRAYSWLIACLAPSPNALPALMGCLCLVCNVAIACESVLLARRLCPNARWSGLVAAVLAMSVRTFELGWSATIHLDYMVPSLLANVIVMAGLILAFDGQIIASMALGGVAALLHPLIGLEVGVLTFGAFVLAHLHAGACGHRAWILRAAIAAMIMGGVAAVLLVPQFGQASLADTEFVRIIAFIRTPHHHVPSTFNIMQWPAAVAFLVVCAALLHRDWDRRETRVSLMVSSICAMIVILCAGGYLFVEVWPSRLWATAQVYRLLYTVKWLGIVLIGGMLAELLEQPRPFISGLVGALHPVTLLGFMGVRSVTLRLPERWRKAAEWAILLCMVAAGFVFWTVFPTPAPSVIMLAVGTVLVFVGDKVWSSRWLSALATCSLVLVVAAFWQTHIPHVMHVPGGDGPHIDVRLIDCAMSTEACDMAAYIREHTEEDCIVATPPGWSQFRLVAQRAVVVDFKAVVHADAGLTDWYERLVDCYGEPTQGGVLAVQEWSANWAQIGAADLGRVHARYVADYAIIDIITATDLPVVYANDSLKLVDLR